MQGNESSTNGENKIPPKQAEYKSLFTSREVRAIVKDFIAAYVSGQVQITFPSAESIMALASREGKKLTMKEAAEQEWQNKRHFSDEIAIATGTKKATIEDQQTVLNHLYQTIIFCRLGNRIDGVFMEYALERRIRNLEEGLDKVNHLVEEIVEWLMKGEK